MTLDEAIKHCLEVAGEQQERADSAELIDILDGLDVEACKECAADHRQLAEWLTELKEAKRLLKAAIEDFNVLGIELDSNCELCGFRLGCEECPLHRAGINCRCWKHQDEALTLLGKDANVPASADDTNVGHKSGGWISVKDRLPEAVNKDVNGKIAFSDFVLVYLVCDDGFTYITNDKCRVDNKSWLHEIPGEGCKVTHWMPLPEPPKGGDSNG